MFSSTAEIPTEGPGFCLGTGVVVPGVQEGEVAHPSEGSEPLPGLKQGVWDGLVLDSFPYPQAFVDSWVCHCMFCVSHLLCRCCWPQTLFGASDCPPELEIVKHINVVRASKDICSDQLEELLTGHPIFPTIKISCTNCLC